MAVILIAALDGNGAIVATGNTFNTYDEAVAYFNNRSGSASWHDLDEEDQKLTLLSAMRFFAGINWIGGRYSITQPLDWPRIAIRENERSPSTAPSGYGVYANGGLFDHNGRLWLTTQIPTHVKNAQCEFALALLESAVLSTPGKYKRRIIEDANGLLEYNTIADLGAIANHAMRELTSVTLANAMTARG